MFNYTSKIANLLMIVFPLLFAANVCYIMNKESQLDSNWVEDNTKPNILNENYDLYDDSCIYYIPINLTFTVLLAFIWNTKKAIKIGIL